MDRRSLEEAKLEVEYNRHKKVITQWEIVFYKSIGKRPVRADMNVAPVLVRESYRKYRETKKLILKLKSKEKQESKETQGTLESQTPLKIFRNSQPLEGPLPSSVANSNTTTLQKPEEKSIEPAPSHSLLYGKISNKLSSGLAVAQQGKPGVVHTEIELENLTHCSINGHDAVDVTQTDADHESPLRHSNGKSIRFSSNNTSRMSNINAISACLDFHQNDSSYSRRDSSRLRHVDSGWLNRCDDELMQTSDEITDSTLDSNVQASCSQLSSDLSEAMDIQQLISEIDASIAPPTAVSNSQDKESSELGTTSELGFTNLDNSFVMSIDTIREVVNEVSQLTSNSSGNQHLQPIDLDPFAFEPVIPVTPVKNNVTPTKMKANLDNAESQNDSHSSNKRSYSELSPQASEESDGPKRKFFKSKRGYRATVTIKPAIGLLTPIKRNKKGRLSANSKTKPAKNKPKTGITDEKSKQTRGNANKLNKISSSFPARKKSAYPLAQQKTQKQSKKIAYDTPSGFGNVSENYKAQSCDIYEEVMKSNTGNKRRRIKQVKMPKSDYMQMKINSGQVNGNFVKIDVSKKVFVRGRRNKMTGAKMKMLDWKARKATASMDSKVQVHKCKKCGDIGHFAKFCLQGQVDKDIEPDCTDSSPFPTLQEAAMMIYRKSLPAVPTKRVCVYEADTQSQLMSTDNLEAVSPAQSVSPGCPAKRAELMSTSMDIIDSESFLSQGIEPVFSQNATECQESKILHEALLKFGYQDFRPGQREAISRTLRGLSTLVILSTGSGKTLCYQLPAYLYSQHYPGALTLCISPLVSLMEDQVIAMPPFLHGACLHTMMTTVQREKVLEKVRKKKLQILLVSPEAICSGLFGLLRDPENFPPVSFVCVDEVHCVSEWSHNFRPSYLKLCKILRDKLKVSAILGLTATATSRTCLSICDQLQVEPSSVIRGEIIPPNLNLSVSRDVDRDEALIYLLSQGRFQDCDSIIIYCTRRDECARIATLIRTKIDSYVVAVTPTSRKKVSSLCEVYHAGISGFHRKLVQNHFMTGKLRIVVATVAFGMGIDKSDIRAVIHYNMPKTFESYVQEIGRAGRDGKPAHCHLFLDSVKGKDLNELRRHVHVNSVDRSTVRKLVKKIFKPCKCAKIEALKSNPQEHKPDVKIVPRNPCPGHEVSFSVEETTLDLDLPEENIETLLCYLELDTSRKWIELLPKCYQLCKIQSYGGPRLLRDAAHRCSSLAVAIAVQTEKKKFKETDSHVEFNLVQVAATVGWSSAVVRRELKKLEWTGTEFDDKGNPTKFRKSGLLVEFSELAYRLISPGDLNGDEYDQILDILHGRNLDQETTQLYQLHRVHQALHSVSSESAMGINAGFSEEKCEKLKKFVCDYFNESTSSVPPEWKKLNTSKLSQNSEKEDDIRRDVRNLLQSHQETQFTGRAVARIFHGISSPCFPSEHWYKSRAFWRRYLQVDFHYLCQIASQEIIAYN